MELENKTLFLIGAGAAAVIIGALVLKKAGGVVADAAQAVNPLNNDNIINQGFTELYQAITGSDDTLGGDIYDVTHDGTLDPTSQNNVVNKSFTSFYQWLTGSTGTLGADIYDWTH